MDQAVNIDSLQRELSTTDARASAMLATLLRMGYVPECHKPLVTEIVNAARDARDTYETAIFGAPLSPFRMEDRVEIVAEPNLGERGRITVLEAGCQVASVLLDSGRVVSPINVGNLRRGA